jgi:Mor family transcriptional regulator
MNLWDEIKAVDFEDDPMAVLIEAVGLSTAKKLVEVFGGDAFYFPKVESVIRTARNKRIYKEFTGFNHKDLAGKYKLTTRHVREIVKEQRNINPKSKCRDQELF